MPKTGTVKEHQLYSEALQEEMNLLVYLPHNYSPLYKYTVLIAQDGKDYFQLGRVPRLLDQLNEEEKIENLIFVGVPYKNVKDRYDKYHPSGSQHDAYVRFIARELVPFIDELYPTYNIGIGRALIGDSLAGTVSFQTALKYPNTFGRVIMQSPLVNDDVILNAEQFKDVQLINFYHIIGKGETSVKTTNGSEANFLEPNRELHQVMEGKNYSVFYDEFDGEHSWKYWQPDLKRVMEKMFGKTSY
ncbi:alpha/beta hydrolase [Jeotgalibacillus haloalkalitolerans]|uniref:Esterase family protein n=1 Tax=Jeotgalibacillus haloalkalitolerans TaxID=3104292 RepID=A0ABU5KPG4_9BACL|nr:esterase family protein [Jeotgalibacillus sp. HH7-29]MDZ5712978.1 esterase family protein [Jeotgalibacillus sp. HH7-29]